MRALGVAGSELEDEAERSMAKKSRRSQRRVRKFQFIVILPLMCYVNVLQPNDSFCYFCKMAESIDDSELIHCWCVELRIP